MGVSKTRGYLESKAQNPELPTGTHFQFYGLMTTENCVACQVLSLVGAGVIEVPEFIIFTIVNA